MMLSLSLDIAGLGLLLLLAVYVMVLHGRMGRLRSSLDEAGAILPALNAAVDQMNQTANGFSKRVQAEIEAVDSRLAGVKRLAADLTGASRNAEELLANLDRQLRQAKRLDTARAAALPRDQVEPKGFAERVASTLHAGGLTFAGRPAVAAAPVGESSERTVRVNML